MRFLVIFAAVFGFACAEVVFASSRTLIVIGAMGDEADAKSTGRVADQIVEALSRRGMIGDQVKILSNRVTRATVLETLESMAPWDKGTEFWLILLGHAGVTQGDMPAFQVSGPRFTAEDLRDVLAAIPVQKFVFLGMERSGAFLPFLKLPDCTVLAATAETGEINQPRFPLHWAESLAANPKDPLAVIAARAALATEKEYDTLQLAQGEHARLLEDDRILEPPFGVTDAAINQPPPSPPPVSPQLSAAEIQIPKPETDAIFEIKPATDETRAIITAAQAVENPGKHAALILLQERNFLVNSDYSTVDSMRMRVLLSRAESFDEWACYRFEQDPPRLITTIDGARIILPDASSVVLNPAHLPAAAPKNELGLPGTLEVLFPQVRPGSVVEISVRTEKHPDLTLPAFYQELELQHAIPTLRSRVELQVPKKGEFHYRLKNTSNKPIISESEHSKNLTWNFDLLPAFESLPLDPPRRDVVAWLGVSSMGSWEDFAAWYLRISQGAGDAGAGVKAEAETIQRENPTRIARIKAAFELVSSIRYVAIELGIGALRPRTPETVLRQRYGDCKDKANLLVALLRAMEISADFALVNRGSSTDADFPGWQFNHAIAYLPEDKLWLDTTDSTTPFGTIAMGNLGCLALVFHGKNATFRRVEGSVPSSLREEWTFENKVDGVFAGSLREERGGLADDIMRQQVSRLSPLQREFFSVRQLSDLLPGAEFSLVEISDPSDLKSPMLRKSTVTAERKNAPLPGLDFLEDFAVKTRDRSMHINGGHPLHYEQIVQIKFPTPFGDRNQNINFRREAAGNVFTIATRRLDDHTLQRLATCELSKAIISSVDYPAMRQALRDWTRELEKPLHTYE